MECKISKQCGSCKYIQMDYQKQLIKKHQDYQNLYKDFKVKVHDVVGMEHPYEYRNKVIVAFDNQYNYGLYEENSHKIVPMKQCLLHDEETHKILNKIQLLLKKYRMSVYVANRN